MKVPVLNLQGEKIKEIELPEFFSEKIREDVVRKVVEARKVSQPYSPFYLAGKQYSASGKIRHARRKWKTSYGRGISRVPRKIFWRRGTQFYWAGATISGTRGGRQAHPPQVNRKRLKINKKEEKLALKSAISASANEEILKKKYSSIEKIEIKLPIVIDSNILELKTKEFNKVMKNILKNLYYVSLRKKSVRAGKGKLRGRKYKKTAGLLVVIGNNEKLNMNVDKKQAKLVSVSDLAKGGLGRLCIYTENAIHDLKSRIEGKNGGKLIRKPEVFL